MLKVVISTSWNTGDNEFLVRLALNKSVRMEFTGIRICMKFLK